MSEQGLSPDSLFHVCLRLDVASTFAVREVCRAWAAVMKAAWPFRVLDVDELLNAFGDQQCLKRFACIARSDLRPSTLKLSPQLLPGPYLTYLSLLFGAGLRELDLSGVQVTNADLNLIPKPVLSRLRSIIVAPEDPLISILSIAPLTSCRELRSLRWEGFVVLKAALLASVIENNRSLVSLSLEVSCFIWSFSIKCSFFR